MDINFAQVAAAIAATLAPFTPYLVEGGKRFAGKAGEAAFTEAQIIWGKIKAHFGEDPKIKGAALMVSADPQDETSQAMLAKAIAARLKEKPELTQELFGLMGGQDAVQKVLANHSWVKNVVQEMSGGGKQTVSAKDSAVEGVRQVKH